MLMRETLQVNLVKEKRCEEAQSIKQRTDMLMRADTPRNSLVKDPRCSRSAEQRTERTDQGS
jgi:hypothetical protein